MSFENSSDIISIAYNLRQYTPYTLVHDRQKSKINSISTFAQLQADIPQERSLYLVNKDNWDSAIEVSKEYFINILCFDKVDVPIMSETAYANTNLLLFCGRDKATIMPLLLSLIVDGCQIPPLHEVLLNALNSVNNELLATTIKYIMGNPVYIRDTSLELVSTSVPNHKVTARNFKEQIFYSPAVLKKLRFIKEPEITFDCGPTPCIIAPIFVGDILVAYMFIAAHYAEFGENDLMYARVISQAVAVEMQKNHLFKFHAGYTYEYYLIRLLDGTPNADIYLLNLDLHLEGFLHLLVFEIPQSYHDLPLGEKILSRELNRIIDAKLYSVYNNKIVMLVSRNSDVLFSKGQLEELTELVSEKEIIGGISKIYTKVGNTSDMYHQTLDILNLVGLLNKNYGIYQYEDVVNYMVLQAFLSKHSLIHCLDSRIKKLIEDDYNMGTNNYTVLKTYVNTCLSVKQTSEYMYMHRNSIQYRLNKIREQYGIDTENIQDIVNIFMSTYILDLQPEIINDSL